MKIFHGMFYIIIIIRPCGFYVNVWPYRFLKKHFGNVPLSFYWRGSECGIILIFDCVFWWWWTLFWRQVSQIHFQFHFRKCMKPVTNRIEFHTFADINFMVNEENHKSFGKVLHVVIINALIISTFIVTCMFYFPFRLKRCFSHGPMHLILTYKEDVLWAKPNKQPAKLYSTPK